MQRLMPLFIRAKQSAHPLETGTNPNTCCGLRNGVTELLESRLRKFQGTADQRRKQESLSEEETQKQPTGCPLTRAMQAADLLLGPLQTTIGSCWVCTRRQPRQHCSVQTTTQYGSTPQEYYPPRVQKLKKRKNEKKPPNPPPSPTKKTNQTKPNKPKKTVHLLVLIKRGLTLSPQSFFQN